MTMITPSYLGETIEYSSLHACRSTLEDPTTDPGVQGDRSTGGTKPATLETGATIQVPLFISTGERIKVDTRTGQYLGRA